MKLLKATKRFTYYEEDYDQKTTHNTGEYDILTCGCYRKPVQKGKTFLATCYCAIHKQKTLVMGILDTAPLSCFKYDQNGEIII